jgi:hypothetical protein
MQRTMRGRRALFPSPRIRRAPHFPHLHPTVGLGVVSSTGGAAGTPLNERGRNDPERPSWKSGHCCGSKFRNPT